jgi:hypothetical protein
MNSRRQFLAHLGVGALGVGAAFGFSGESRDAGPDAPLPDGSASKGMITQETEHAIDRGLEYLMRRRLGNGSYGTGAYAGNVAVTSLAALAFLASGSQPNRGPYGRHITEALKFILSQENRDGRHPGFLHNPQATPHGPMYGHGFATLFLAEVHGMVPDADLRAETRDKLKRAVQLILDSQNRDGGWRYHPNSHDADISVTICQIMALRAARNAGFAVPKNKVDHCVEYVKLCQDRREGWFRYMKQGGGLGNQAFARTAAGVSALYSAGIYKGSEVEAGLKYLMTCKPSGGFVKTDMQYFYGHYYAAQAMWTAGGTYWSEWFPAIRDELVGRQRVDGSWVDQICTHYATAMACIILQIPNNYLPILQK